MITVRAAQPADADTLLSLIDALADYEKLDRPTSDARQRLVSDAFTVSPPRFWAFLAFDDAQPTTAIGYALVFETYSTFLARPTLYLEDLFVHPDARGAGAGNALFQFVAQEAIRRNCGRLEWVCLNWNQLAINFYEKRGAVHLDEWRAYRLTAAELRNNTKNA